MMMRILCLSILLMLLCTDIKADENILKCYACYSGKDCNYHRLCLLGEVCASAAANELGDGELKKTTYTRSCTSPSYCPKDSDTDIVSIGLGYQLFEANVKCCNSSLCNFQHQTHPKLSSGNGLWCLFCDDRGIKQTCKLRECVGEQRYCVNITKYDKKKSGCATKNFCYPDKYLGPNRDSFGFAGAFEFPAQCQEAKPKNETEPFEEPKTGNIEPNKYSHSCYDCDGKDCNKLRSCLPGQVCMAAAVNVLSHGELQKTHNSSCTSPSYCQKDSDKDIVSIGLGSQLFVANVKCCNYRECNFRPQRHPKIPSGNGLWCLFCDDIKYQLSCKMRECVGEQRYCVKMTRSGTTQTGCATKNFCYTDTYLGENRRSYGFAGYLTFPATCQNATTSKEPKDIEAGDKTTLKCFVCTGKDCKSEKVCQRGQVCMTSTTIDYFGGRKGITWYTKECASPAYCQEESKKDSVSVGLGSQLFMTNFKCCNSWFCNYQPPPEPKIPSGNGLWCLFCDKLSNEKCEMRECVGEQRYCAQIYSYAWLMSGCATKNFCYLRSGLNHYSMAGQLTFPARCQEAKPNPEKTTAEPTTEEPTTEEPTTEEPTTEEPTTEEPTTNEPTTEEPTTEEPTTEEPTTKEPTTEEPTTNEPTTNEPMTEEPMTEEPTTEEPTTDEPTTEEPTTEEPTTEEPMTEEPTTEEPTTDEPTTEEPKSVPIKTAPELTGFDLMFYMASRTKETNADGGWQARGTSDILKGLKHLHKRQDKHNLDVLREVKVLKMEILNLKKEVQTIVDEQTEE